MNKTTVAQPAKTTSYTPSAKAVLQRYANQAAGNADTAPTTSVDSVLASPGKSLEPSLQQGAEQRFGHEFSRMRVHSVASAEQSPSLPNSQRHTKDEGENGLVALRESYRAGQHNEVTRVVDSHRGAVAGSPLSPTLQSTMSRHFGRSVSDVRIHTDSWSAAAASGLAANAFTVGHDIFFSAGQFAPESAEGRMRLAHEVAHTMQQSGSGGGTPGEGQIAMLEQQAERAAILGRLAGPLTVTGRMVLREPTYPRRTTGDRMIQEAEKIVTTAKDTGSKDEVTKLWSQVGTNFPGVDTVGSLARRVWTNLFLRHFVEPESQPGVESAHPRYFYSKTYGWIDGQHFFGFIDFAEQQFKNNGGGKQKALTQATNEGIDIEKKQQTVRDFVVFGASPPTGGNSVDNTTRLLQVQPPNTPAFRAPPAVAGAVMSTIATIVASLPEMIGGLGGTKGELFSLLDANMRAKFYTDNAKSAFSYEDIVSNQLGTRFFLSHGIAINIRPPAERPSLFSAALASFFKDIMVENDPKKVDELAKAMLPAKERFTAPKTTEDAERKKHPELFNLPP